MGVSSLPKTVATASRLRFEPRPSTLTARSPSHPIKKYTALKVTQDHCSWRIVLDLSSLICLTDEDDYLYLIPRACQRANDLKPSGVEDELEESEHGEIEIAGVVVQRLSSEQTGQEERVYSYRDDLRQEQDVEIQLEIHRDSKKHDTKLLAITSLTIIRFSKFFQ